jgi:Fe2+ transport system protein B
VGKSVVFGALTGTYVTVSNYPGTTVEITRGRAPFGEHVWEVVDTPGTHNLVPMTEDEAVTRDLLVSEAHDALVQVGDAKNLARTLLLSFQIAELGIPFCLDLNMLDEARARGLSLDLEKLEDLLPGVRVNASTAIDGEGLDAVRAYLASCDAKAAESNEPRQALACAPRFPEDVEAAIRRVESEIDPSLPVARRALATMLLGGERGIPGALATRTSPAAKQTARELAQQLSRAHGVPPFALFSRLRLAHAQAVVRQVQRREDSGLAGGKDASGARVPWGRAAGVALLGALVSALVYDGALERTLVPSPVDPLASYGFFAVIGRLFSADLGRGWHAASLGLLVAAVLLGARVVRRNAHLRAGAWKLVGAFALGWTAYWVADRVERLAGMPFDSVPVQLGAGCGLAALALAAVFGSRRDAALSAALGRWSTHPLGGLAILGVVLLLAYKVVGEFGAGTAVDFVENRVFGSVAASSNLDATSAQNVIDVADEGAQRLVVTGGEGSATSRIVEAQVKRGGIYVADPEARVDIYARGASVVRLGDGRFSITGAGPGAEARIWTGQLNRWAFRFFYALGVPLLTAFFVGPYGLLTMGVTYAVAIVMPVVATFFFVFSMLEDSGYLPRLAVMSNRLLRGMGLNGRAVLPMVLGLGCDTMATLTARIMETRKERALVTLLLALAIPCSSQLSVIFALMQRTSHVATLVWLAVVIGTLLGVGWIAARLLPGEKGDFLLEMPPIRQPMVGNLVAKTMARIEWYLKEAVPLFLAGTALLFVLDAAHLLVFVHRAGEPIVYHLLGFPRGGGVSDRVSEALLVGFLRRDFGAAGLLEMARAGRLSPADVAVSMVTITLFIPCIANVFMIAKERGWRAAGAMSAFIFPYAVAVGSAVRFGFRLFGG